MQLKPYTCIHCGKQTNQFALVRLKYGQRQLEYSFGGYYDKDYKTVDHGEAPVFVCGECIRKSLFQGKAYYMRMICALLTAAAALLAVLTGNGAAIKMAIFPLLIYAVVPFVRYSQLKEAIASQKKNYLSSRTGLSRESSANLAITSELNLGMFAPLALSLVLIIVLLCVTGAAALLVVSWVMLILFGLLAIVFFVIILSKNAAAKLSDPDAVRAAAKYYFLRDEDIYLEE